MPRPAQCPSTAQPLLYHLKRSAAVPLIAFTSPGYALCTPCRPERRLLFNPVSCHFPGAPVLCYQSPPCGLSVPLIDPTWNTGALRSANTEVAGLTQPVNIPSESKAIFCAGSANNRSFAQVGCSLGDFLTPVYEFGIFRVVKNLGLLVNAWSDADRLYLVIIARARLASIVSPERTKLETPASGLHLPTGRMPENTTIQSPEPLPIWWAVPDYKQHPIQSVLFRSLCLISMTRTSLEHHWKSKLDDNEWDKHKKSVVDRLGGTNIAAGLVLTTSAVFVSTQPPLTTFLPYTIRGCYILALGAFAHALGGLLCGLAVVNIYEGCDRKWAKNVLTATRFRLCCTLLFISWPAISLTISIVFLMLSLLIACYASGVWWLQFLATIEILSWAWLPPLFARCALEEILQGNLWASLRQTRTSLYFCF